MANSFEHISIAAVKVLAKQAALLLVKDELRRQGIRVQSVPARDIQISAIQYVDEHPELIDAARDRAQRLGMFERRRRCNSEPRMNSGVLLNETHQRKSER